MNSIAQARDRFDKKTKRGAPPPHRPELGPCLEWTAAKAVGYGLFWIGDRLVQAHRVAFFFAHGRWPDPFCLHKCDNRGCVEPTHLFEGTHGDNMADMVAKGRWNLSGHRSNAGKMPSGDEHWSRRSPEKCARGASVTHSGEEHGCHKLTDAVVLDVRARYSCGETQLALAAAFGVSQTTIWRIVHRKGWRHLA